MGLEILPMVTEPTAASITNAYVKINNDVKCEASNNNNNNKNNEPYYKKIICLVYDIGGGTLDVTVQRIEAFGNEENDHINFQYKDIGISGDTLCGGQDVDQIVKK